MNRREMLKVGGAALVSTATNRMEGAQPSSHSSARVERWDLFEQSFSGPQGGNPFLDIWTRAVFRKGNREVSVDGFYDGNGTYKIRFMPDEPGMWSFVTDSNAAELKVQVGSHSPPPSRRGV